MLKHTQSLGYLHFAWTDLVSLSSGLEAQMVETRKEKIRWEGASEGKTDRVLGVDKRERIMREKGVSNQRSDWQSLDLCVLVVLIVYTLAFASNR